MIDILKRLAEAKIAGEGMFKPVLQPANLNPQAPSGGGSLFGMSFSGSHAWEHLDEEHNFTFEINTQKLGEREFEVGLTFSGVCAKYEDHFIDITSMDKKCVDRAKFEATQKAVDACVKQKQDKWLEMRKQNVISESAFLKLYGDASKEPCIP